MDALTWSLRASALIICAAAVFGQIPLDSQAIETARGMDARHIAIKNSLLKNYDAGLRPNETGNPVHMTAHIKIVKARKIEEIMEAFTLDIYLSLYWYDYRLRNNATQEIVFQSEAISKIWTPDVYFPDALESTKHAVTKENKALFLRNDGSILLNQRVTTKVTCKLNLHAFPLDSHECELELRSFAYKESHIKLKWKEPEAVEMKEKVLAQYVIASMRTETATDGQGIGVSQLKLYITYKRQLGYYILQVYIPCSLVVMSAWLSFWLDGAEAGDRISLGITSMLAIVFLLQFINASLPKVSYAKGIDYYLIACFVQVFCGLAETVYVATIAENHGKTPISQRRTTKRATTASRHNELPIHDEVNSYNVTKGNANDNENGGTAVSLEGRSHHATATPKRCYNAKRIDNICKVVFPLIFAIFNLVYWIYYTR
eukprot:Seg132.4 transcript_id=Seg132.4/GoldUCD/mRNA.D3Y31 product="Gamma-aminobutyric acid receptor subunit gamma-1" protein_id=Seg132.4/GoldUCD/D3Y31